MKICISFLRGVNMAGHNIIKMSELSLLYKELGFTDAFTYIQSGNVIFTLKGEKDVALAGSEIENAILEKFGYDVPVMIRTEEEIRNLISVNPFLDYENFDPSKMAVIFLHEKPSEAQIGKVINADYPPDKFKISDSEIFIYCPDGFGRTKIYTGFFEKKMGVRGTGRNWNTITTLLNLAGKL
jgi:uncharacterized protein (DUF1697 family)